MVDVDFELYSHSLLWLDCERRCIVTYIVMASEERYYGCRQKVSSERSLETQKHLDELQEFTSKLKIKEEARDVQVSISHDENYDKIWPSSNINVPSDIGHIQDDVKWAERAVGITTNIFDNFEISIRDWGGGGKSYFYEPILPPSGNLLNGVILSAWDNIIGPKAVFVWIQRAEQGTIGERVVQEAVEYTVGHTLHGELEKMNVGSTVARGTEVYLVEDLGFIIFSMPFSAQRDQDFVPHSLSFVIPSAEMKSFTNLNPLFSLWIQRLAYRLTGYLHHNDYGMALTELSPEIVELCHLLNSLSIAGLILAKKQISIDIDIERQFLKPILRKAITSHLQTCCCSVVIGDSLKVVNCVVSILALFLRPKERALVRFALDRDMPWPYHPGLLVQGMLKGVHGDVNISAEHILCNLYPTTVVDVSQDEVRQSWLLHEHLKHRNSRLKQEWAAMRSNSKPTPSLTQNIFIRASESSPLVSDFIEKIWLLEFEVDRRQNLVSLFLRKLEHTAFALIKLLNIAVHQVQHLHDPVYFSMKKNVRRQLDLENDADFLIVLAFAERLQPGIYTFMMEDSSSQEREISF